MRRAIIRRIPLALLRESVVLAVAIQGILVALVHFAGLGTPTRLDALLPDPLVEAWNLQLLAGCLLVLVGVTRDLPRAEAAGLRLMAPCQAIYAVAILMVAGWAGVGSALPQVLFGLACAGRGLWLTEYLAAVEQGRAQAAELIAQAARDEELL
jgi:hypothetical protein